MVSMILSPLLKPRLKSILKLLDRDAMVRVCTTLLRVTTELRLGMCASSFSYSERITLISTQIELLVEARRKRCRHLGRRTSHGEGHRPSPDSEQILGLGDGNAAYPGTRKVLHVRLTEVRISSYDLDLECRGVLEVFPLEIRFMIRYTPSGRQY